jgi:hypothetical protein
MSNDYFSHVGFMVFWILGKTKIDKKSQLPL